jgi:16S rRNA A1518/A1519 N6-dimethyltransferase RsmA/KsgA/DIM1 with predicted DNA glycosylase/AP lyase activity
VNLTHRLLCASPLWKTTVTGRILQWVLNGVDLGAEVLEVGPGYGAATDCLRAGARHLTCVEIDRRLAARLKREMASHNVTVLCEDATRMSLADATCDGAVSLTILHHVPSAHAGTSGQV